MKFVARHEQDEVGVEVERWGAGYRVRVGERVLLADLIAAGPSIRTLRFPDGTQHLVLAHREGAEFRISIAGKKVSVRIEDPLAMRRSRREDEHGGEAVVRAIMPGRVVRVLVAPGEEVRKGMGMIILEAMKMENEIAAPRDGRIAEIHVTQGATVEGGASLVTLE